jgi:hypothetical protein
MNPFDSVYLGGGMICLRVHATLFSGSLPSITSMRFCVAITAIFLRVETNEQRNGEIQTKQRDAWASLLRFATVTLAGVVAKIREIRCFDMPTRQTSPTNESFPFPALHLL